MTTTEELLMCYQEEFIKYQEGRYSTRKFIEILSDIIGENCL